ncbi:MAG: glycoside hydrolase family 127 protein [Actinobacteria bacterium]|nr:glycoside hydrolase family 127 protein [Actinomycetota bacterium]
MSRSLPPNTFWGSRWHQVGTVTVPHLLARLESHGAVDHFRSPDAPRRGWWFADSDVYKWLEGAVLAERLDLAEPVAEAIVGAQAADGYLHTFFAERRYQRLEGSHELYCMGHFIEAAVAHHAITGDTWLLDAAVRVGDHVVAEFGPGGAHEGATDGHPEIEIALCALGRAVGDSRYALQARRFVDAVPGALDRPSGHAVRALYLATGAWDAAIALDDHELADTVRRWWTELVDTRMYITGGVGGRWVNESIGRPYELPNEMAYAETCAAVAAARLAERLGDVAIERRITHNALLAGVSDDGCSWFYSSPLTATHGDEANPWYFGDFSASSVLERFPARRLPWYDVTCCPTNLTRWLAALPDWHGADDDPVSEALAASPRAVQGHPRNEAARGCVAVELGPFVLCAEEADVPSLRGGDIALVELGQVAPCADGLPGIDAVLQPIAWEGAAFGGHERRDEPRHGTLRPFHSWGNRGFGAMTVWLRR